MKLNHKLRYSILSLLNSKTLLNTSILCISYSFIFLMICFLNSAYAFAAGETAVFESISKLSNIIIFSSTSLALVGVGVGAFLMKLSLGKYERIETGRSIIRNCIWAWLLINSLAGINAFVLTYLPHKPVLAVSTPIESVTPGSSTPANLENQDPFSKPQTLEGKFSASADLENQYPFSKTQSKDGTSSTPSALENQYPFSKPQSKDITSSNPSTPQNQDPFPKPQSKDITSSNPSTPQNQDPFSKPKSKTSTSSSSANGPDEFVSGRNNTPLRRIEANSGYGKNKQKISSAADKLGASKSEKAVLLAIANLETDDMTSNYIYGDGKSGDAANYGLYKMNVGHINRYGNYTGSMDDLNTNPELATKVALTAMRNQGITNFLKEHRGGPSGLNGTIDTSDYVNGIQEIAREYYNDPALMTNDKRVDRYVKPI